MSKAGSPHQAHSASSSTGPSAPTRMFFGLTSPCTRATRVRLRRLHQRLDPRRQVRMARAPSPAGRARGGCRRRSHRWRTRPRARGRAAENAWMRASTCADGARRVRVGVAVAQRLLPQHVARRLEVAHHQHAEARMLAEHLGGAAGRRVLRHLHPARLVQVALDRRAPVGGDAQLRQGALGAHRPARGVDLPDVGGDAAGQRPAEQRLGAGQPELAQRLRELRGDRRSLLASAAAQPWRPDSTSLTSACSAWLAGVGDAELAAAPGDEAVEMVDLARLAARHVLGGGRQLCRHRRGDALHRLERARAAAGRRRRPRRPPRLRRRPRAAARGSTAAPPSAVRRLRQSGDRVVGAVHHQLRPQLGHHVGRDPHRHLGGREQVDQALEARGQRRHPRRRRRAARRSRGRRDRSA